jgi:hypothetical protein
MGQPMQSESLHPSSVAVTSEEAGAVFQSILHFPDSVQYETRRRAPTNCCHLLPFHAILCHPMPSHALPYHAAATMHHTPTMPHNTTMLPCHDPPHALPLPFHATAAICCHPCHAIPCPAPTMLLPPCTILPPCHITPPCYHAMTHHMSCPQIQETHTMV